MQDRISDMSLFHVNGKYKNRDPPAAVAMHAKLPTWAPTYTIQAHAS